ncbi:MAG: hypothetical protein IPP48_14095 [Chitinophagaceae bacterium]|nr:hypothetical protein [Chitinophagaceae bacterium]
MNDLISNAQINILPSFNNTGVKLKLINALFIGRHCLTNTAGVVGSGLEELCYTCNTGDEFLKRIEELISVPIIKNDIECRTQILQQLYNNEANALKLLEIISSI